MDDLAKQVFDQATMLQKRYMDGFKAGQASVGAKLESSRNEKEFLTDEFNALHKQLSELTRLLEEK